DALLQALGLCFATATLALAAALALRGVFPVHTLAPSLLALLPTLLGMLAGTWL
ncbi:MAG TPA: sulfite exporter TauE/SafE family protein, partial [Xanthomonadaceae bacterium]|nr:sulfite exporter TauE/SafE family protein [Xanthomonadaceae bacterium]